MAAVRGISGAGRALLLVGAAALMASIVLPSVVPSLSWFTLSGTNPELPAGTYTAWGITEVLFGLAPGQYAFLGYVAWIVFGLLIVAVTGAIAAAGMARRTRNVGTGTLLLLLIEGALLYYTAYGLSLPPAGTPAVLSVGYGFVAAVAGAALIEAGGRLPGRVPMGVGVPTGAPDQDNL
jgi:hypothetical protein